eukprot:3166267-Alexandrium_andersonii.AAC.1
MCIRDRLVAVHQAPPELPFCSMQGDLVLRGAIHAALTTALLPRLADCKYLICRISGLKAASYLECAM